MFAINSQLFYKKLKKSKEKCLYSHVSIYNFSSGQEEQPHMQGAVAAQAQEGLEKLFQVQGQEGRQLGDNPRPR